MFSLPVLTFHALAATSHVVAWPEAAFDAMVLRLARRGRTPQGLDAIEACQAGRSVAKGGYLVTFDDGYESVVAAHASCRRVGGRIVLFLATSLPESNPIFPGETECPVQAAVTWSELRELVKDGAEVASHGHRHVDLRKLSDFEIEHELINAKAALRDYLGVAPRAFAYPFGAVNARVRGIVGAHHALAFGTRLGAVTAESDALDMPRLEAHYFRHLSTRGDLDGIAVQAYIGVRRVLRAVRGSFHG